MTSFARATKKRHKVRAIRARATKKRHRVRAIRGLPCCVTHAPDDERFHQVGFSDRLGKVLVVRHVEERLETVVLSLWQPRSVQRTNGIRVKCSPDQISVETTT